MRDRPENSFTSICVYGSKKRDSSVGIAGSKVRFSAGDGHFSLQNRAQNGSGAHLASYEMGTKGSFPRTKATVA
jgi:hypothetical protein